MNRSWSVMPDCGMMWLPTDATGAAAHNSLTA